jgi:hypothetical protein
VIDKWNKSILYIELPNYLSLLPGEYILYILEAIKEYKKVLFLELKWLIIKFKCWVRTRKILSHQ